MPSPTVSRRADLLARTRARHWVILLLLCAAVYWPGLGVGHLSMTEGHRSIPGWEAIETGRWFPLTMFGAEYLRKPPGMPWAVALSSMVFGETEFAARLPSALSATLMAMLAMIFAARWFGRQWGIVAGLAQALLPRLWPAARSAEIEAMLCLGAQVAAFALIHALVHRKRTTGSAAWFWAVVAAGGFVVAALAKGHAGLPVAAGALVAACLVRRSGRPLLSPAAWGSLMISAAAVAPLAWMHWRAAQGQGSVSEDVSKFLWDARRLTDWAVFPAAVFLGAMPMSLVLLFPWGPDARAECAGAPLDERPRLFAVARTLAIGFAVAVAIYWLAGVSNERYALPALVLLPPLAAYVARGAAEFFTPLRARIARVMSLGSPWVILSLLLVAVVVHRAAIEPKRLARSTHDAGITLAASIPPGAEVRAGGMINAKPELMWYAVRESRRHGEPFTARWAPDELAAAAMPPPGSFLLLSERERARYEAAGLMPRLEARTAGEADGIPFTLYAVLPNAP